MTDEIPDDFKQLYDSLTLPTTTDDEYQTALKVYRHCEGKIAQLQAEVERLSLYKNMAKEFGLSWFGDMEELIAERDQLKSWQVLAVEALTTVTNVLDSDDPAIVDTVWVPDQPETLHDLCISVLEQVTPAPPVGCTMGEHACADSSQCFEPCGALGHDEAHAVVSDQEGGKQS